MKMKNDPEVSVLCITYNQADYIEQCINSILSQKTTFKFELLINDDCSNDGTREIVENYALRFPDIIKPVFHSTNQFSKGINPTSTYLFPRARGKYFAMCEGDDYWIDENKLQKQYELMEKSPETALCGHASINVSAEDCRKLAPNRPFSKTGFYSFRDFVDVEQIPPMATASLFFRGQAYGEYVASGYVDKAAHGDFKMEMYFTAISPIAYIDEQMSAYRILAKGSINRGIMRRKDWRDVERNLTESRVSYLRDIASIVSNEEREGVLALIDALEYRGALVVNDVQCLLRRWPVEFRSENIDTRVKTRLYSLLPCIQSMVRIIKSFR